MDKDCLIVIDEVAITSGKIYDPADGTYLGYVTLPDATDTNDLADSGLIFMAAIQNKYDNPSQKERSLYIFS